MSIKTTPTENTNGKSNGYYVFGKNNAQLVRDQLEALHFHRYDSLPNGGVKFNWITRHTDIDWRTFDSAWQLLNHIGDEKQLSNKGLLVTNLRNYERDIFKKNRSNNVKPVFDLTSYIPLKIFLPETYLLDNATDRMNFKKVLREGSTWICKPVGLSCGREVFLFRTEEELQTRLSEYHQNNRKNLYSNVYCDRLVQKYIETPLLINKHKFDIRTYFLCVCLPKEILCFAAQTGYLRLSMYEYDLNNTDQFIHLTNQSIQCKNEQFSALRNQTGMTMEEFNTYFNEQIQPTMPDVDKDWVMNELPKRITQILTQVADSVRYQLIRREGCFGYYGVDILIDERLNCWLLEINSGPTLDMTNAALQTVIPMCLNAAIQIVIESLSNYRSSGSAFPLRQSPLFKYLPSNVPSVISNSFPSDLFTTHRLIDLTPGTVTSIRRKLNRRSPSSAVKPHRSTLEKSIPAKMKKRPSAVRKTTTKIHRKHFSEQLTEIIRRNTRPIST